MRADSANLSRLALVVKVTNEALQFIRTRDRKFRADYEILVVIKNSAGQEVETRKTKGAAFADNFKQTESIRLVNTSNINFDLPPDKYEVSVSVTDLETSKQGVKKFTGILKDFSSTEFAVSDIVFAEAGVEKGDGVIYIPPQSAETTPNGESLNAYFEVYNVPAGDSFIVSYKILDYEQKPMAEVSYPIQSQGPVSRINIRLDGSALPHGQYATKLTVKHKQDSIDVEKALNWHWRGLPIAFDDLSKAIDALRYIASKGELKKLKAAKHDQQHEAFMKFWERRDPTPGTAENELMEEYYRRIQYANENFSSSFREGWKTDMGMVYVKLGPPDQVERNPYNQNLAYFPGRTIKALQAWTYYSYNRQLVFFDENGFGDYRLANPETFYSMIRE
ncbi:MAG: GWxTD domain-containing protein [bacterium]